MRFKSVIKSRVFLKNILFALILAFVILGAILIWLRLYTHHGKSRPVPNLVTLNLEEVEELLEKNNLMYVVFDSAYTDMVPRGTVYRQNPPAGFRVKKHRKVFLTMNAVNPDSVSVPNIIGNSLRQARSQIENAGLHVGRLMYYPDIAINNVLRARMQGQEIQPGTRIVKGSSVDLDLGKGLSNETTSIPFLIGITHEDARKKVLGASLNIGAITFDETVKNLLDSLQAFVWKQNPVYDPQRRMNLGAPVYLWMTLDSLKLPVPDTTGINPPAFDE